MKRTLWLTALTLITCISTCAQPATSTNPPPPDTSPHKVQFVTVDKDVKLEVLDWGGTGRPLIFLPGLGFDAHVFDTFAPKFVPAYHVYGITRRGFGASTAPPPDDSNYAADRLGDDVLAVIDTLSIQRPILIGHSLAGEELSSIGTRHPEKVAALIYLDAGYAYAYYNDHAAEGEPVVDVIQVRRELTKLLIPTNPIAERKAIVSHMLDVSLPRLEKDLAAIQKQMQSMPANAPGPPDTPQVRISAAIMCGVQSYSGVKIPVLAIFAVPHAMPPQPNADEAAQKARIAEDLARTGAQADAFQAGNPTARVVRLPNADHFVFRSNEADVLREMNTFLSTLP
jgi:non-heme chloroperoxidase